MARHYIQLSALRNREIICRTYKQITRILLLHQNAACISPSEKFCIDYIITSYIRKFMFKRSCNLKGEVTFKFIFFINQICSYLNPVRVKNCCCCFYLLWFLIFMVIEGHVTLNINVAQWSQASV